MRRALKRISDQAKAHFLKASLDAPAHPFRDMLNDPKFHIFYHAPVLVVITAAVPTDWAIEDCALAAENLMLAAYAKGLGTCWIGFAQQWLATAEGKAALGVPAAFSPIAPIVVGHPRRQPPPSPANPPTSVGLTLILPGRDGPDPLPHDRRLTGNARGHPRRSRL